LVVLFQWPLALRLSLQAAWFRLSLALLALASVALLLSLPVRARVPVTLVEPRQSRRDPPLSMLAVWLHWLVARLALRPVAVRQSLVLLPVPAVAL